MSLNKENSLLVQKYKIAREEYESINSVYKSGMRDLNAHLDLLKSRLSENIENQKERFDKSFFPKEDSSQEPDKTTSNLNPKWAKKIFREVVLMTHPDKSQFVPVESVRSKFLKYYNLAVESYNKGSLEDLVFVAADIGIEVEDDIVSEVIAPKLEKLILESEKIKGTVAYEWAHIENDQKLPKLKKILQNLGYVFDQKDVEEAIEEVKRIKRKRGTRPVNYIRRRIKS